MLEDIYLCAPWRVLKVNILFSEREVFNNLATQLVVLALTYAALKFVSWSRLTIFLNSNLNQIYPSWLYSLQKNLGYNFHSSAINANSS